MGHELTLQSGLIPISYHNDLHMMLSAVSKEMTSKTYPIALDGHNIRDGGRFLNAGQNNQSAEDGHAGAVMYRRLAGP